MYSITVMTMTNLGRCRFYAARRELPNGCDFEKVKKVVT